MTAQIVFACHIESSSEHCRAFRRVRFQDAVAVLQRKFQTAPGTTVVDDNASLPAEFVWNPVLDQLASETAPARRVGRKGLLGLAPSTRDTARSFRASGRSQRQSQTALEVGAAMMSPCGRYKRALLRQRPSLNGRGMLGSPLSPYPFLLTPPQYFSKRAKGNPHKPQQPPHRALTLVPPFRQPKASPKAP